MYVYIMKCTVRFGFKRFSFPTVRFGRFGLYISDGSDGSIYKFDAKSCILTSKSEIFTSKSEILTSKTEILKSESQILTTKS